MRRRNRSQSAAGNRLGAVMMGALAGLAVGILLSDRGMLAGLRKTRRKSTTAKPRREAPAADVRPIRSERAPRRPVDDEAELEARVLETFRNDPILVDRPIDIGAIGTGIIELTGWVDRAEEVRHATTLTRGTIGVHTVINRLLVRGASPTA
ncbi:MAG TPA: BON domain-containing protein [Gemmatimonadaceae bacterium]|nr:BON domain-containing protein [Gemmatimonadaceae bacterium]